MKSHTFRLFRGGRRRMKVVNEQLDGYCNLEEREIYLDPRGDGKRVGLENALHEAIHALCDRAPEPWVSWLAKEISRWLWARGYRPG